MSNIEHRVINNPEGVLVSEMRFPPNGTTHDLQLLITGLMHNRVVDVAKFTLAEIGYLHLNTLTYNKENGQLYLKVYFDVHYAARPVRNETNSKMDLVPIAELNVFKNYLFVGDIRDCVTLEKIMAPKTKAVVDELERASLQFKEDSSKIVETDALVLHCSLPIAMAAAMDYSLADPCFNVSCETVGKGGKNAVKSIVTTSNNAEVPVSVTISHTHDDEGRYDPEDAEPYLTALMDRLQRAEQNRNKLKQSVRKTAKKNDKKQSKKKNKAFNKYS